MTRARIAGLVAVALLALPWLALAVLALLTPLPRELGEAPWPSVRVLSRGGQLLREVRADDGARSRPLPLGDFAPNARLAMLAAEDRRFYRHLGVDPIAVTRAAISNALHGRVVSGASTLTMQLARTLRPHPSGLIGKIREAALAMRIEMSLSKDQIIEAYLNRVSFGPNLRGYAAASQAYLGKDPGGLSLAEAALVAALPRRPSAFWEERASAQLKRRRDLILERMRDAGFVSADACERAQTEPMARSATRPVFGAPHLVAGLLRGQLREAQTGLSAALSVAPPAVLRTTLDPALQGAVQATLHAVLGRLSAQRVTAGAVIVLENATGDVLAYVGSPDFFDDEHLGQNDGVRALRQPGSALKPFVYAEAMERLGYTAATMLPDVELHIPLPGGGDYVPHDYDNLVRGPVRLREALGNSLNIPAVFTIQKVGTARVLERLRALGFDSLDRPAEYYGPALALGDGEVSLLALTGAYATIARGGLRISPRFVSELERGSGERVALGVAAGERVLEEATALTLEDILADREARLAAFGARNALELPFDVGAKTGTSRDYRDNWAVGFTREVTVGVWVGNFDGSPMAGVSGITGAAPVLREVMQIAMADRRPAPLGIEPRSDRHGLGHAKICPLSGKLATPACPHPITEWLPVVEAEHGAMCDMHEIVAIDRRNGLRAGQGCSAEGIVERMFERFDPPFDVWAARTGRSVAPGAFSPECPGAVDEPATARVLYPLDGSSFLVDPERPRAAQALELRAAGGRGAPVELYLDGALVATAQGSIVQHWPLEVGEHVLFAKSAGVESSAVHIRVR